MEVPQWVIDKYGPVNIRKHEATSAFRLVELRTSVGAANYVVKVLDKDAISLEGELVARHWPYREFHPDLDPLPEGEWFTTGKYGPTNENGDIGFGSGGGDYYDPYPTVPDPTLGTVGASSFWVLEGPSDCVENIGTLAGTEHEHLDMTFMWIAGTEPDPGDPNVELAEAEVVDALLHNDEIKYHLNNALRALGE